MDIQYYEQVEQEQRLAFAAREIMRDKEEGMVQFVSIGGQLFIKPSDELESMIKERK